MCELTLVIPDHDPIETEGYSGGIQSGKYNQNGTVALFQQHAENADAVRFIADILEE